MERNMIPPQSAEVVMPIYRITFSLTIGLLGGAAFLLAAWLHERTK